MSLRVLIVDDEPLARERLRSLLEAEPDVEVLGECRDGEEAVAAIERLAPDVVFLDIQMPELDGFGVIERLGAEKMPPVVLVTAYDQYALQAFEVHALDYLLKPFDQDRFKKALARARDAAALGPGGEWSRRLVSLIQDIKSQPAFLQRFVIRSSGRIFLLKTEEIDWIQASGNYVELHAGGQSHLLRDTMNAVEQRLDPARFIRIHRSVIVNIERIKELQPSFHGEYVILLRDGTRLTLSRGYRDRLQSLLEDAL